LKATGQVGNPVITPNLVTCQMGYSTNYAIFVHEILENYHVPPTKAKFLEDPVNKNISKVTESINRRISVLLGGA